MPDLRVVLEQPSARESSLLAWVAEWLGLRLVVVDADPRDPRPVLYRGRDRPVGVRGIMIPVHPDDRVWAELLDGAITAADISPHLRFDLISAMAAHLDDVEHAKPAGRDRHGRLRFAGSFANRHGIGHLAIVDRYLNVLGELVARELGVRGVPRWPDGRTGAIALSHDVDRPVKWGALRAASTGRRPRRGQLPRFGAKVAWTTIQRLRAGAPDDFWLFEPLMNAEAERGIRSTFLFAATPAFSALGFPDDVYYDIEWPEFAHVFDEIARRGFEIGLHASYGAFQSEEALADERDRLARRSGTAIPGLRHHFWHLGPDEASTLRMHESVGFAWDASLAYNDHPGFRRGVGLPFHPWDAGLARPITTLQLPTVCMDASLFRGPHVPADPASAVDRVIDEVVAVGGFGALDWHVRSSLPRNREFSLWGATYLSVLDRLAADRRIWVTSLDTAARWVIDRRERIARVP